MPVFFTAISVHPAYSPEQYGHQIIPVLFYFYIPFITNSLAVHNQEATE